MILFDTHALYWYFFEPEKLTANVRTAIRKADALKMQAAISVLTIYELIYSMNRGRMNNRLSTSALLNLIQNEFSVLPVTQEIALQAAELDNQFHGDPMDRMITATAMRYQCELITADERIQMADVCKTVW